VSRVVFDISMSLDGYITGPNVTAEEPQGDGGLRLVEWARADDERSREVLARGVGSTGAVICGRRTYDLSLPWWKADGPTGQARLPVFVLTHDPPPDPPPDGVYTFPGTGIEGTLSAAREAAGDKTVCVMGGAETGRQYIRAGLVDELSIHLVPIVLGAGTKLFDGDDLALEPLEAVHTPAATHLRYRVNR
jgi:dihydrofolate reductase